MALIAALLGMILFALFLIHISMGRLHEILSDTLRTQKQTQNDIQGISQHLYRSENKFNYSEHEALL